MRFANGLPLALAPTLVTTQANDASWQDGIISIPLTRIMNQTNYGMQFEVGNPCQQSTLIVDTGSDTIGFSSPRSNLCLRSDSPCDALGTYDNRTSSTAVVAFPAGGYPNYRDGLIDMGQGIFINDTVRFQDISIDNFMFGTLDTLNLKVALVAKASSVAGIMGLKPLCLSAACDTFPNLLQQLADLHIIKSRAFSIYLGPDEPGAVGNLLLGGIDRAKRDGPVFTLPTRHPWSFEYSSFTLDYGSRGAPNKTIFPIGPGNETDWDTGATSWGLPSAVFDAIAAVFGISPTVDLHTAPFEVDCRKRNILSKTLEVGFPGNATVAIPLGRLVTQLDSGKCVTFILPGIGAGGVSTIATNFGAPFLRSVYATYDLDKMTASFSQVKYTDKEDIIAVTPSSPAHGQSNASS